MTNFYDVYASFTNEDNVTAEVQINVNPYFASNPYNAKLQSVNDLIDSMEYYSDRVMNAVTYETELFEHEDNFVLCITFHLRNGTHCVHIYEDFKAIIKEGN